MTEDLRVPALLHNPRFIISAHDRAQWPADNGAEIAFAGRSNVGKSSAINAMTNRRNLARTSKTPGRTQQIVFFALDVDRRLVDLPGYGYAKVPKPLRQHWGQMIERYLRSRTSLRGLILLMDIRHPLTVLDHQMLEWCASTGVAVHILLTKSDKLSRANASRTLIEVQANLHESYDRLSLQLFSTVDRTGWSEARAVLIKWLDAL